METPKPRKRPQSPEVSRVQLGASSVAESLAYESVGSNGLSNAHSISQVGIYEDAPQEPLAEVMEALPSGEMALQFLDDLDLESSDYHFMFRTPRSPSLAMQYEAPPGALNPRGISLDDPNLRPQILGLSGDMDPFLLQRYRTDEMGNFKFKQLSIQSVQQDPFPVHFLTSHPSLFTRSRIEAGHQSCPDEESRSNLEAIISPEMGKRLIALYQKFIAPQYPIFSTEQLPDPASAPPSLLAAIYAIAFSFATYDDQLCIDFAYDSPPFESLSRIIESTLSAELHSPSLSLVQSLVLVAARPSADPHVSDASFRWSTLSMLIAAAVNVGLHLDPSGWQILPWQISQRRRLSFVIYSLDRWLAATLGRPPNISESNWLVTSIQATDELCSGLSDAQWNELLIYSSLTSILAKTLSNL